MALPDLAAVADLSARGVNVDDEDVAGVFLAVASSVVRKAAQSPILSTTSTVDVWAEDRDRYLDLPGKPITAVSAVSVDGTALVSTDYKLIHGRLWRLYGWGCPYAPAKVTVTLTHGFAATPDWVVQLVCDLAIAGMDAAEGGARDPRVAVESIDDYSVTFTQQGQPVATAMELPSATRQALRRAFGGGVSLVVSR